MSDPEFDDVNETLPERPRDDPVDEVPPPTPAQRLGAAADAMGEFNRILWQVAKGVWIIVLMLLGVFGVAIAFLIAKGGVSFL